MTAQRTAGTIALISGAALLILAILSSAVGLLSGASAWTTTAGAAGTATGPWMMGRGVGPGMMGGGMGPGMMGSGHMGAYGGAPAGTTAPIAGAQTVTVTATEFAFSPAEITLPLGEANLRLVNKGAVLHDLTIQALGIRVVAAAGQSTTVGIRSLPAGRYAAYCSVPGHADAGMRMTVIVQ